MGFTTIFERNLSKRSLTSSLFVPSPAIHFLRRAPAREQAHRRPMDALLAGHSPYQAVHEAKFSHACMKNLASCPPWHGSLYFRKLCHV